MPFFRWLLLSIVSLFAACSLAVASEAAPKSADFDRLIDLSLARADVVEVLRSFATITGVELHAPDGVQGEVTVELDDVPIRQALHQICRLRHLRCELLSGHGSEPGRLWVRAAGDGESPVPSGFFETLSFSLVGAGGREVLEAFSKVAGRPLQIEPGELSPIRLELRHAPWPVALQEICDLAGCEVSWRSRWRVVPDSKPSARRRSLALDGTPLEEVLRSLADDPIWGPLGPLRLEIPSELADESRTMVSVEVESAPWPELLAALCEPVGLVCGVRYGAPSILEVRAAEPAKEPAHESGIEPTKEPAHESGIEPTPSTTAGITLGLRWSRAGQLLAAQTVSLDWEHPGAELADGDGGRLRVVWVPFRPGHQDLLPIAYRCNGADLEVLPPLALPPAPGSVSARGLHELRVEAATQSATDSVRRPSPSACPTPGGAPLGVALGPRPALADDPPGPALLLEARTGALLLLVPADDRDPAAALVSLGDDTQGWRRLALLRPRSEGEAPAGARLEQLALAPGTTLEILLESTDDVLALTLPES